MAGETNDPSASMAHKPPIGVPSGDALLVAAAEGVGGLEGGGEGVAAALHGAEVDPDRVQATVQVARVPHDGPPRWQGTGSSGGIGEVFRGEAASTPKKIIIQKKRK